MPGHRWSERSDHIVCRNDDEMKKNMRDLAEEAIKRLRQHDSEFLLITRDDQGEGMIAYGLVLGLATEPNRPMTGLIEVVEQIKHVLDEMVESEMEKMDPGQVLLEMLMRDGEGEEGGFTI